MNSTFLGVVYFIAFSHALMLAIALWRRTSAGNSGRLLAIILAVLAYKLFEGGAQYSGFYRYVPHLLDLMPLMVLLLGPLFYAYTRQVTARASFSAHLWLLHLLPWLAMWLVFNTDDVFRPAELKVAFYDRLAALRAGEPSPQLPTLTIAILLSVKAHLATYLILGWRQLNQFVTVAKNLRSDSSPQQLQQLRFLATALILLEVTWVALFVAQQYLGWGTLSYVSEVWLLFIAIIVLAIGLSSLQNPAIAFSHEERIVVESSTENTSNLSTASGAKIKYLNSALPASATNALAKEIEQTLRNGQLYLTPNLTLTDLARALNQKSHTLSQVISQGMNSNFYQLINSYRVQHAVELLENNQITWPIERIALESGFNNRVTFNKAFKQIMGCTASEYKKQDSEAC